MPPTLTFPGVYVQEVASGVRPIAGVSTATALFIAASGGGPLDDPTLILGYDEFAETFGTDIAISELPRQVRLFFMNGGTTAYVMRIANGATNAEVTLQNEAAQPVLVITASSPGAMGEHLRLRVSYNAAAPDSAFDVEVFRWDYDGAGNRTATQLETFTGLSMDPASSRYAPVLLTQQSRLIDAVEAPGAPGATNGSSQAGLAVPWRSTANGSFRDQWADLIGSTGPAAADQTLTISVDGGDPVPVALDGIVLSGLPTATIQAALADAIATAITDAHTNVGRPGVNVDVAFVPGPAIDTVDDALHGGTNFDVTSYLLLTSTTPGGSVVVTPEGGQLARTLRLGTELGGREIGAHAARRPAPNAAVLDDGALAALGALTHADLDEVVLDGETIAIPPSAVPTTPFFVPAAGGYAAGRGGLDGIVERLRVVRDAINSHAASVPTFRWAAELWGPRLAIRRTDGNDNATLPADFATGPTDLAGDFSDNVRLYSVGVAGQSLGAQVSSAVVAIDGNPPQSTDYDAAYTIAERELDIFNLLILPETTAAGAVDRKVLWGPASTFCQRNRAFLLVDPPPTWTDHRDPLDGTGADDSLTDLKIGLVKDHAAIHYPDLLVFENGSRVSTSPSGAIAGLMARTDTNRGVWKAAAGTDADIRGIVGVKRAFSDAENGNLNPKGINTIRRFPTGIVNWGARTMDGDDSSGSEYKYVPIRRLLLYLEESIYRGLQWTVFEPNGTDLWAAIRLNTGNFLNGLFRQGAFAGTTASEAYYVKCDAETTTPTDRALGIVNVHIGVATLKPAEFVVLYFRQITLPEG